MGREDWKRLGARPPTKETPDPGSTNATREAQPISFASFIASAMSIGLNFSLPCMAAI